MIHRILKASAIALIFVAVATSHAGSISLVPTSATTDLQDADIVSFDIVIDFTDEPTLGGGFDIVFNPLAVQFESFYRDPSIGIPEFSRDPDIFEGLLESWAVSDFNGIPSEATLGSVVFSVLPGMGQSTVIATQATNGIGGPWVSFLDFRGLILDVDYGSSTISRVPLPAAFWLMLSAVAVLVGHRRRKTLQTV